MARFYANENFPLPAVEELRRLGHDVLTVMDTGKAGHSVSDEAVLAFASAENRVLLTFNRRHFVRLHVARPEHAGIVACSVDPDFVGLALRVHAALEVQGEVAGMLIRVTRPAP